MDIQQPATLAESRKAPIVVGSGDWLGCVKFIKAKIKEAEEKLRLREEMQRVWSGGTDESWRRAGNYEPKSFRLQRAATHGRIAVKNREEVEMFRAVLKQLESKI